MRAMLGIRPISFAMTLFWKSAQSLFLFSASRPRRSPFWKKPAACASSRAMIWRVLACSLPAAMAMRAILFGSDRASNARPNESCLEAGYGRLFFDLARRVLEQGLASAFMVAVGCAHG